MQSLPYGKDQIHFELPWAEYDTFVPESINPKFPAQELIKKAFHSPMIAKDDNIPGDLSWKSIAIAINDQTRQLPHSDILPELLKYLKNRGAKDKQITFFISTGTHRKLSDNEIDTVLPDGLDEEYSWICHNCDDDDALIYIGYTSIRNQVYINKKYYQSDVKIVVGNIEPHHFMGFSGGVKTAAIGLTGRVTIEKNHSLLTEPDAKLGIYESNPMRRDVEEIGRMIGINYALNVVLNDDKQICAAFWGEPRLVLEAGIPVALDICQVNREVENCRYDLVIASAGGFPKDINLYQAQKAVTNACLFSIENGVIILAAECRDGAGNEKFKDYMQDKQTWQQVINDFDDRSFQIGPHKAYLIARQAVNHKIILVSDMPDEAVKSLMLTPAKDIPHALDIARQFLPAEPRIAILPYATHSLPKL